MIANALFLTTAIFIAVGLVLGQETTRIKSAKKSGNQMVKDQFRASHWGGYFLRRQFRRFAGASRGYRDDLLIEKILSNKHGQVYMSGKKTIFYHLCSRPFYSAHSAIPITDPGASAPPFAVKAKLMAFDYVLSNQKHRYLATEEEKVGYFTGELGIKIDSLPKKIYSSRKTEFTTDRYFVDKFPIYLSASFNLRSPFATSIRV